MQTTVTAECMYGLGGTCVAELPRMSLEGLSAREFSARVAGQPQVTEAARRTARNIKRLLVSKRHFDVEVSRGSNGTTSEPELISPDDKVLADEQEDRDTPTTERVSMRLSEHFVGGQELSDKDFGT